MLLVEGIDHITYLMSLVGELDLNGDRYTSADDQENPSRPTS
jgi:hypothetical protein